MSATLLLLIWFAGACTHVSTCVVRINQNESPNSRIEAIYMHALLALYNINSSQSFSIEGLLIISVSI